jgi:molybdate transport system substrate-binding protein
VRLSFAASGALARQIEQGAAADVFISADEAWMDYLQQRGLIAATTRRALLGNRLVLVVPASRPVDIALTPGVDLRRLFKPGERWVTGDPASVPVGRYAQQALTALDAWPWMQARLASADNVRAALAFVERGEAAAGIVYRTDALLSSRVHVAGVFSSGTHAPIVYPAAALAGGDLAGAQRFLDYLRGASGTGPGQARAVFLRHGFDTLP